MMALPEALFVGLSSIVPESFRNKVSPKMLFEEEQQRFNEYWEVFEKDPEAGPQKIALDTAKKFSEICSGGDWDDCVQGFMPIMIMYGKLIERLVEVNHKVSISGCD